MMVASGQKKARGQSANGRQDCYRSQIHRLQADVEELLRKQLALDLQRQKLLGMEQVLLKIVSQQEQVVREVARLNMLLKCGRHGGSTDLLGDVPPSAAPAQDCSSYCAHLLHTATPADIKRARSLTKEGWCKYFSRITAQICLLLEVASRDAACQQHSSGQPAPSQPMLAAMQDSMHPQAAFCTTPFLVPDTFWVAQQHSSLLHGITNSSCAAHDSMQKLVDEFTRTVLLAKYVGDNTSQYRAASLIDLTTGAAGLETGSESHWVHVARAVQLSEEQILHLQLGHEQFNRCRAALKTKQVSACQQVEAEITSKLQHLGLGDHPKGPQQQLEEERLSDPRRFSTLASTSGAPPGDQPAAPKPPDAQDEDSMQRLQGLLQSHMGAQQMLMVFVLDTLTPEQRARAMVASYPYLPQPGPLMEGIRNMILQDGKEQQQQQQQQQPRDQQNSEEQQPRDSTGHQQAVPSSGNGIDHTFKLLMASSKQKGALDFRRVSMEQQKQSFWQKHQHLLRLAQQQMPGSSSGAATDTA